jgi:hypothetical protein
MKRSESSQSAGLGRRKKRVTSPIRAIAASRLDRMHDSGSDLTAHMDIVKARRPGREVQRVNVDFPKDLLHAIDDEAKRIGISRQAFIKLRLADVLRVSGTHTS